MEHPQGSITGSKQAFVPASVFDFWAVSGDPAQIPTWE